MNEDSHMDIEPITAVTLSRVETAHGSINAAYNALALDRTRDPLDADVKLARGYLNDARTHLTPGEGHDGQDDALAAARAVMPRLDRAMQLLDELEVSKDPAHVAPLLDELGIAMDHVEQTLAAVGREL